MSDDEFLTTVEAAEFLGVPVSTLYYWALLRRDGRQVGPEFLDFGPRSRRYVKQDLLAFQQAKRR